MQFHPKKPVQQALRKEYSVKYHHLNAQREISYHETLKETSNIVSFGRHLEVLLPLAKRKRLAPVNTRDHTKLAKASIIIYLNCVFPW